MDRFPSRLASIFGESRMKVDRDVIASYCSDYNGLNRGEALAVVFPQTVGEVVSVIDLCRRENVKIVPQGGNTSDYGGSVPDGSGNSVIVNMSRMDRILEVDTGNNTALVEAGVVLGELNAHLAGLGRWFPVTLGSQASCQIGGNIAMNSGGNTVLRHGMVRENVMGIEAVFGNGHIFSNLRGLRKQCIGYDLGQLLIGSEGTLGIVTKAVLRLQPLPRATATAWLAAETLEAALEVLDLARAAAGDKISAFEVISQLQRRIIEDYNPALRDPLGGGYEWAVLVEFSDAGDDQALRETMERILVSALEMRTITDAVVATSEAQRQLFWKIRESVLDANKAHGWPVTHDASVPVSQLPAFARQVDTRVGKVFPQARFLAAGHAGDGNIHLGVIFPREAFATPGEYKDATARINEIVFDIAIALGGHFSSEHGIGVKHIRSFRKYMPESNLAVMKSMKAALDPDGIMNPGKIFS